MGVEGKSLTREESYYRLTNDFFVEPLRDWITRKERERGLDSELSLEPKSGPPDHRKSGVRLVNVNTASEEELNSLPGVGSAIARCIIEGRPYGTIDSLLKVKGIGEKNLEKLRPFIRAN
jgi:competence ComEA-like helix-hairpin-helix protein